MLIPWTRTTRVQGIVASAKYISLFCFMQLPAYTYF